MAQNKRVHMLNQRDTWRDQLAVGLLLQKSSSPMLPFTDVLPVHNDIINYVLEYQ